MGYFRSHLGKIYIIMYDHACMIVEVHHLIEYILNAETLKEFYMTVEV